MSGHVYQMLPTQAQEDALHAQRLLQVEERPFERVRKKICGSDSLIRWTGPKQLPSPPPDDQDPGSAATDAEDEQARRDAFREDILFDFAAVESSILRIHLIQASNERERQRYAMEKAKILETAQAVKNNTLELRAQLAEAQTLLELRKGYDKLAARLIDPAKLKPRAETQEDIEKLEKEIEDLRHESVDYEIVWAGRREAFDRVVGEGENMIKVIKGIKDEPEPEADKDDRMEDGDDGEHSVKRARSNVGTPAPETGGRTPMLEAATPLPDTAAHTPKASTDILDEENGIKHSSLAATPLFQAQDDVDMVEGHPVSLPELMEVGEDSEPLQPLPKTTAGMEATADQVSTPAEGMEGDEDQVTIVEESGFPDEQLPAPIEEMDET